MKRFFSLFIILIFLFSTTNVQALNNKLVRTEIGYGELTTTSGNGYFEVEYDGIGGHSISITLKNSCSSAVSFVYYSIEKPDGTYFFNNIYLSSNDEKTFYINYAQPGKYKIHYIAYSPNTTILMQCWIN